MRKDASLSIIEDLENQKVLMIKHLRGINQGFVNFSGGKKEEGETIEDCVRRETLEETGLIIENPKQVGYVEFPTSDYYVTIFKSTKFSGTLKAREGEVEVFWQDKNNIPLDKMRDSDKDFVPEIMAGNYVKKRYIYDKDFKLKEIINLPLEDWEQKIR